MRSEQSFRSLRRWFRHVVVLGAALGAALVAVPLLSTAPAAASAESAYTIQATTIGDTGVCRLAHVDLTTGVLTPIGDYLSSETSYACATDLALAPDGGLYGLAQLVVQAKGLVTDGVHLVKFDTTTGAVTDLGPIGSMDSELFRQGGGLTFDAAGDLFAYIYASTTDSNCLGQFCLFQVDPTDPAAAQFVGVGGDQSTLLFGLTATCAGAARTLEGPAVAGKVAAAGGVTVQGSAIQLDAADTSTGAATLVGTPFDEGVRMQSLDYDESGTLWAIGTDKSLANPGDAAVDGGGVTPQAFDAGLVFTIDPTTGVATPGATLSAPDTENTIALALAVAPLSCTVPTTTTTTTTTAPPAAAPSAIAVTPRFTG